MSAPEHPHTIPLREARRCFLNTISVLTEADSAFRPADGAYTVAQQVEHSAATVDWFANAAADGEFDLDFEKHHRQTLATTSLAAACDHFETAMAAIIASFAAMDQAQLMAPLPPNPIMGEVPKIAMISAVQDHTAHHRGSLAVYARLLGKVPPMPYGEGPA